MTAIFSLFALFSTVGGERRRFAAERAHYRRHVGWHFVRPRVGIATGIIAGLHRFLIDIHGVSSVPCLITSIIAGVASGWINLKVAKEHRWRLGILGGMLCESLTMLLIILWRAQRRSASISSLRSLSR